MKTIKGGATLWARKTIESDIFFNRPSDWFKIWFYVVNKVNHKDTRLFKRGSNFFTYRQIKDATKTTTGTIDQFVRYLKRSEMCTTQKTTRGFIIFVTNYDRYQQIDTYKKAYKNDTTHEIATKQARNKNDTINKNVKNVKNEEREFSSFSKNETAYKEKRFYKPTGEARRLSQGKWWVLPKHGGEWLLFAGILNKDTEVR